MSVIYPLAAVAGCVLWCSVASAADASEASLATRVAAVETAPLCVVSADGIGAVVVSCQRSDDMALLAGECDCSL